jgi:Ulp1 protease family, C-terminal catalytic domain
MSNSRPLKLLDIEKAKMKNSLSEKILCGLDVEQFVQNDYHDYDSFFTKYTLDGLINILNLRVHNLQKDNIQIVPSTFVDLNNNDITDLFEKLAFIESAVILIPINLFDKHAVGLIIHKSENKIQSIIYQDSLNYSIPKDLETLIFSICGVRCEQSYVEQQKYMNCGPEAVENFIYYLTGERLGQEEAIEAHSILVEHYLLGRDDSVNTSHWDQL